MVQYRDIDVSRIRKFVEDYVNPLISNIGILETRKAYNMVVYLLCYVSVIIIPYICQRALNRIIL